MPELDRRDFLKLVGVGAGAAAASGCSDPVEKLIPYVIQQDTITPGIPLVYASTCRECPVACGLHVTTHEGRPTKLEGNPEHPINQGSLCTRGQAGIGRTYHPDRYAGPMRRGADGALARVAWDEALEELAGKIAANPRGTYLLGGGVGPTASDALDAWVRAVGAGGRVVYEPLAPEAVREAARALFGRAAVPRFDLSGADLVVDFGSDALETGLSPTEHARQLAETRALENGGADARFVYVGARLSTTASNADLWLPVKPGTEGLVALAVARRAGRARGADTRALDRLGRVTVEDAAARSGLDAARIEELADLLARASRPVALPPGVGVATRRAVGSAAAVLALNHALGAFGRAVHLEPEPAERSRASHRETLRLVEAMKAGEVSVLIVHDADPLYSLPASAGFAAALDKVGLVVSTSPLMDQTSERADLVLPDHTPLESWGDAEPRQGVRSLLQPTLRPLLDTRALVDTLHDTGRAMGGAVADAMPPESFRMLVERAWSGTDWRQALARGGVFSEAAPAEVPALAGSGTLEVGEPVLEGEGELTLLAFPHPFLYDGRGASLPWLQEIPDPAVKVAWQSWAEVSRPTAERLGVRTGDVVAVETPAGRLEVPVYPRGGIRDDVIAIPTGQGHTVGYYASLAGDGQPGQARGVNVLDILPAVTDESGGRAWLTARAKVSRTGRFQRLPIVQATDDKRRRVLGQAVPLAVATGEAEGAGHAGGGGHGGEHGGPPSPAYGDVDMPLQAYDPVDDATADSPYRWGMSIDLDRCNGCSACVAACYVENNLPVVGEEGTLRSRQMSWIRLERWVGDGTVEYAGAQGLSRHVRPDSEKLGDTDIRHSPMLCQQCGAAPCESVCPVLATYHNPEGLNGMIYNRCVGTRYCSNNCPYKVRRFNYFDYSKENWPGLFYLMLNPDVTVRGQGVMEKCTFCVQRITRARQTAKDENRLIGDGEVVTACQQACPTRAITFGNLKDRQSTVSKKSDDPRRGYRALHSLNTRPAIAYHAEVTRETGEVSS